jgi:hypothetical protein
MKGVCFVGDFIVLLVGLAMAWAAIRVDDGEGL